ncbi:MAG: hypothetical protein Q9160_008206 [Pyrenula sp. 1 TL-2023]
MHHLGSGPMMLRELLIQPSNIYLILASDPSAIANSLAPSDSCPAYKDNSGAGYVDIWDDIYLPPVTERLNSYIQGDLNLTAADISNFPYLCGFESQITRHVSPFCAIFTKEETRQYEYRQDLRYWYGTGPGSFRNASVMLPVIQGVVDILLSGPETPVKEVNDNTTGMLGPLVVAFTQDNQINQMASSLGVFDEQPPLVADAINDTRVSERLVAMLHTDALANSQIYVSSRIDPMRGTVTFERLSCSGDLYLRILLNDAVYPVPACSSGPGSSCPLQKYNDQVLARKWEEAGGSFASLCRLEEGNNVTTSETGGVTFFTDLTLPAIRTVRP